MCQILEGLLGDNLHVWKLNNDLLNVSRLCEKSVIVNLKSDQWPADVAQPELRFLKWNENNRPKTCQTSAGCEENTPLIRKPTSDLPTSCRFCNWPMTCVMSAGLIQKIFLKWTIAENWPVTCGTSAGWDEYAPLIRKPTSDLPTSDRSCNWPMTCVMLAGLIQTKKCG